MVTVSVEEKVEIPPGIENLEAFRAWTHSDAFPERGRIDFIGGRIEVDMQAEAMYSHVGVKAAILRLLLFLVNDAATSEIYTDRSTQRSGRWRAEKPFAFSPKER